MRLSYGSLALVMAAAGMLGNCQSAPPEEPQATTGAVTDGAMDVMIRKKIMKGKTFACDGLMFKSEEYYYYATKPVVGHLRGMACWANQTNLVDLDEATLSTATCLVAIRVEQGYTCVSVAGSQCDNGYVSSGGRLQSVRQVNKGKGLSDKNKITYAEYAAIRQVMSEMGNLKVDGLGENGPYFIAVTDDPRYEYTSPFEAASPKAYFQVNFIGGETSEC